MTEQEYRALDAVNISTLIHILESPKAYQCALRGAPDKPHLVRGRAFHCALLEPDAFDRRYIVSPYADQRSDAARSWRDAVSMAIFDPAQFARRYVVSPFDDFRTKDARAWRDARIADGAEIVKAADLAMITDTASLYTPASLDRSFEVLQADEAAKLRAAADEVAAHPQVARLLCGGEAERSWTWRDPATGIHCKGRTDYTCPAGLIDVKTTRAIAPRRFQRQAWDLGYLTKMAWYQWGIDQSIGEMLPVYLVSVQLEPYVDTVVYRLDNADLWRAWESQVAPALKLLAECRKTGRWPGIVEDRVLEFELPAWANRDESAPADGAEGDDAADWLDEIA